MQGQIRTYFEIEARELIDRLTRGALELSEQAAVPGYVPAAAAVQMLGRAAHTLKGAAHVVSEARLAGLAHDFEDALAAFTELADAERGRALVSLADALAAELARTREESAETVQEPPVTPAVVVPAPAAAARAPLIERRERRREPAPAAPAASVAARTVRVELSETERLLEQIGESTRNAALLRQAMAGLAADGLANDGLPAGDEAAAEFDAQRMLHTLDRLDRSLAELYRVGSQLRLIAAEDLLLEAGRMVRVTAAALDRAVVCVTRGGRERMDVHVLETLETALLHLVRNAVAHGIEPAAERRALGKAVPATITVALERRGSELRLTCADDGRGIDPERIRAAALAQGLLQAAGAQREKLLELLFRPGFSTAGATDQVAGRGIGLDAVRTALESLEGRVEVDSAPGQGTVFTLAVPQTLAAVPALEVLAGGERYAVPLAAVEQTFLTGRHHKTVWNGVPVQYMWETATLLLGQETMPVLRLGDAAVMGSRRRRSAGDRSGAASRRLDDDAARGRSCLVLNAGSERVAVEVNALAGIGDVLARPLPGFLQVSDGVAGAVLRADGEPMLLLDPAGLARLAATRHAGSAAVMRPEAEVVPDPILVIDDSLTTRMLEQSILEAEGYVVELASSAEQGLERARARRHALYLVDVEMPGMSGFDFVRTVQADAVLRGTPAILVTSLDSAASRAEGLAAGAESYIVKGEFHQQQYLDRVRALAGSPSRRGDSR